MPSCELDDFELGKSFTVAVGQSVDVGTLKTQIDLSGKNVRLFTPYTQPEYGVGSWNPMRVNIHVDQKNRISRINFG